jgi:hypothetical protein
MNTRLSRRDFLKTTGLMAGGRYPPPAPPEGGVRRRTSLGRAMRGLNIHAEPSFESERLNFLPGDSILNLYGTVPGTDASLNNPNWHRVRRGFVHAAVVQEVDWKLQTPLAEVPNGQMLVEVSVPFTDARVGAGPGFRQASRFYYGTTHWVLRTAVDEAGTIWYGVFGDLTKEYTWVEGSHLRRVSTDEVAPISPEVSDKSIEIVLDQQLLRCYEGSTVIKEMRISGGTLLRIDNGVRIYSTPVGDLGVISKRASRHMAGGSLASADGYDLPGVPWVTYIHWWGVAIHGTFWHNDFGTPRSHGCINLPNDQAKWVYRWTAPSVPFSDQWLDADGTRVVVRN